MFSNSWPEITSLHLFFSFYFLIKWLFHKDLVLIFFFLSPSNCGFWFVVGLLQRGAFCRPVVTFHLCEMLPTGKVDLISRKHQIIINSMLKNLSRRYSSHYIIKFRSFIPIYCAINLVIDSS